MKIVEPSFQVLNHMPNMLELIEQAGRVCYQSDSDSKPEDFVRKLIARGHHSVIEHSSITGQFITDRGVTHELVRHRLASFSQESTRYCDYKDDIEFILPTAFRVQPDSLSYQLQRENWEAAMLAAERYYKEMREAGASPQIARSVLPNSLKAEIVMTANVREWRHVFMMRTAIAAHPDIRYLLKRALEIFKFRWPVLFEDINL